VEPKERDQDRRISFGFPDSHGLIADLRQRFRKKMGTAEGAENAEREGLMSSSAISAPSAVRKDFELDF
jgi:hypothetical protein